MKEVILELKQDLQVPLEAETINPDLFAHRNIDEIKRLKLYYGNREIELGDVFRVEGEKSNRIRMMGEIKKVKKIGYGMVDGEIKIEGNVGMHLGAGMKGGKIEVNGNAGDWLGAEMTGGTIIINGDCGDMVGAAYRGNKAGMNRGTIIVRGNAGSNIGERMRRGLIVVEGKAGDFAGAMMRGGTIVLLGAAGIRTGGGMNRGTIVCFKEVEILPTFKYCCEYSPVILRVILQELESLGITISSSWKEGRYKRFLGDISRLGKGEVLLWT